MAQFTHKVTKSYSTDAGTISSVIGIKQADTEVGLQTVVSGAAVNFFRTLNVDKTQIISMAISASKACTIKTNTTGGVNVFTLADGGAIMWNADDITACPVTTTITGIYFDGGGFDSAVRMSFLLNQPGVGS
jgi:hypothetical protein